MSAKSIVSVVGLVIALGSAPYAADKITPPAVPGNLEVEGGFKPFLAGHAVGTQNFICAPAATPSGFDWLFIGPQATLFDTDMKQITTHYQSKNPLQAGAIQATWQHSNDSSAVWAKRKDGSMDANYVAPDAIEWLLLEVTGTQVGPTAGDKFGGTVFIQRVNTVGGMKPPTAECAASTLNTRRLVPYQADYYFYR
jgi:hypothetical protein